MSKEITHKILHEIRNPLNAISMNAELGKMLIEKEQVDTDTLYKLFKIIDEQSKICSLSLQKFE